MPYLHDLIAVIEEARRMLDSPNNDFTWSSWIDRDDALEEIDALLERLRAGQIPTMMGVLFAPTGPMQEVSLSSGWGDEFIDLANRFDAAHGAVHEGTHREPLDSSVASCACRDAPGSLAVVVELGMDSHFAEVSVLCCQRCGQHWLRYAYENESFTRSGRWYLGAVSEQQRSVLTPAIAKQILEELDWYFYGGSYYDGRSGRASGVILLGS